MVKKSILIVDNSPIILVRLGKMLNRMKPAVEIFIASNYNQALEVLLERPVDIAMLDIHLDEQNGIELLKMIKKQYPQILIIMITNQASEQVAIQCKNLGAAFFLDKSKDFTRIPDIISSVIL